MQGLSGGSRFTVLNEKSGDEDRAPGEEGVQQRVVNEGIIERSQNEESFKQQRKLDKAGSRGATNKGIDKAGNNKLGRILQEKGKARVERVKNVPARTQNVFECSSRMEKQSRLWSPECVPESIMDMKQGQRMNMARKENLHPGDNGIRVAALEDMEIRGLQGVDDEEDVIESLGISMEEECRTPVLAE